MGLAMMTNSSTVNSAAANGPQGSLMNSPSAAAAASASASAGAAAAAAGLTGSSSVTVITAAALAGVAKIQYGDVTFFHAPGNPDLHAPLGGGLEAWLGFRQSGADTQSGPALVMDVTAAPFFEPGPVVQLLPTLLGRAGAAAAAAAAAACDAAAAGGGAAAAPMTNNILPPLSCLEHGQLEQMLRGVKVRWFFLLKPYQPK
jgi:hypothetical protein